MIDRLDGELHQHAKAGPRVKILRTLPGVGEFTALVMPAEIGDFGLSDATLTANSVLIPVAHYVHYRNLTEQYRTAPGAKQDSHSCARLGDAEPGQAGRLGIPSGYAE